MDLATTIAALKQALEARDGDAAQREMAIAVAAIHQGARLTGPLTAEWAACEQLALQYHAELAQALRGNATTSRAVRAYEENEAQR